MDRKTLWCWLGVVPAVGFLLSAAPNPRSFQDCMHNRKNERTFQALHQKDAPLINSIRSRIQLNLTCGFITANENNGAIAALAGIIVAFFTGTLWWATSGMWRSAEKQRADMLSATKASEDAARAAEKSANAAVGVEIPRLAIQSIEFLNSGATGIEEKLRYPRIVVVLKNYGRPPAFIEQESFCFKIGVTLPDHLEYDYAVDQPAGKAIEAGDIYRLERSGNLPRINDNIIGEIIKEINSLWIYGYIFYFDFLDMPRWFNFRAQYQVPPSPDGKTFEGAWHSRHPIRQNDWDPEIVE